MATPNPMFAKFDQALGIKTPTAMSPVSTRANDIRAQAAQIPENPSGYEGLKQDLSKDVAPKIATVVGNTKDAFMGKKNVEDAAIQNAGEIVSGLGNVGVDVIKSIFKPEIRSAVAHAVQGGAQNLVDSEHPAVKAILDNPLLTKFSNAVHAFQEKNPEGAKDLEALFNVASIAPVGKGANIVKDTAEAGLDLAKAELPSVVAPSVEKATATMAPLTDRVGPAKKIVDKLNSNPIQGVEDSTSGILKEGEQVTPEKARTVAWQDIQPKGTPTTKLEYAKGGNVSDQTTFKGGKLTPTKADEKLLDTHSKLYEDGTLHENMSPTEKQRAVNQKAAQLNADQKGFLAENDKAVNLTTPPKPSSGEAPSKGLFNVLQDIRNKSIVPFSKDVTAKGAYDSTIQMFKNELTTGMKSGATKGATTLTSIDKALTNFGKEMEKFGAWEKTRTGELTDTAKARVMAIRDIYSSARDFIAGELGPNNPWKSIRAEETNLYEISDRLAQRIADTVDTSKATQMIENTPIIKAGVGLIKKSIPYGVGAHL